MSGLVVLFLSSVAVTVNVFLVYVIWRRSPKVMGTFKLYMLKMAITDLLFASTISFLFCPLLIFPLPGAIVTGLFKYFGRTGALLAFIVMVVSGGMMLLSVNDCCLYRIFVFYKMRKWVKFLSNKMVLLVIAAEYIVIYSVMGGITCAAQAPYDELLDYATRRGLQRAMSLIHPEDPFIAFDMDSPEVLAGMGVIVSFIVSTAAFNFWSNYKVYQKINENKSSMSKETYKVHKSLSLVLLAQAVIPGMCIGCPVFVYQIALYFSFTEDLQSVVPEWLPVLITAGYPFANSCFCLYSMKPMSLVIFTTIFIIGYYLWTKYLAEIWRTYQYGQKIPGPAGIPLLGNSLQMGMDTEMNKYFTNLTQEYARKGDNVIRLWFAHQLTVFPINGKAAKDILDNSVEINKSSDYDIMKPWLGDGLLMSSGEKWKNRRRLLTPTFHFSMVEGYIQTMDKHARKLVDYLGQWTEKKEDVDVFPIIKRTALDIICETAMGMELNSVANENHPYAVAVAEMGRVASVYSFTPYYWFEPFWKLSGWAAIFDKLIVTLTSFTDEVIKARKLARKEADYDEEEERKSRKSFLDMLLDMEETQSFTDEDLREQVDTFMFAGILWPVQGGSEIVGHDTTSTAVGWTIWSLATHPKIQEEVAEEVCRVLEGIEEITLKYIKEMHYLDRVIKETMRVNPTVPFIGRNLQNDLQMDGYTIPRSTNVAITPLMIHRNETIYPEPMKFDPDRWLPENCKGRHAYDYIPFSAGPRNCIGMKFAQYEARVILSWLIKNFRFSTNMKFLDNQGCPEIILRPEHGVPVYLSRRL